MTARNIVLSGDYKDSPVNINSGVACINFNAESIKLTSDNVKSFNSTTDKKKNNDRAVKNVGTAGIFGPISSISAGLSARKQIIYEVSIEFTNGKKSLLEVNHTINKAIKKNCK